MSLVSQSPSFEKDQEVNVPSTHHRIHLQTRVRVRVAAASIGAAAPQDIAARQRGGAAWFKLQGRFTGGRAQCGVDEHISLGLSACSKRGACV